VLESDSVDAVQRMSEAPTMQAVPESTVMKWNKADVKKWLHDNELEDMKDWLVDCGLYRSALSFIFVMKFVCARLLISIS